jgi:hypothetical protein
MDEHPPITETVVALMVMILIGTQTWILVNDATQGDAARRVKWWWERSARPVIVRLVTWVDAGAITDRMMTEEIVPFLAKGEA